MEQRTSEVFISDFLLWETTVIAPVQSFGFISHIGGKIGTIKFTEVSHANLNPWKIFQDIIDWKYSGRGGVGMERGTTYLGENKE